ncbi:SRPBCC family protein [Modestobacter sp. I12A-02628]|uniref:SRPBCC family protein n=1 Tax=Goekera deserti TaxID=2497753 RepID=A0A7K3WHX7_9ACTN|nr:SRPBCC family protein [Goekera deserti]MPQ97817.1 SRPBCC family protein [Goekera deserti]NDI48462.1 SRPBCC family protein [Goekera deserti]NEL56064.1 SRPBCC family protein [Goekera deserti]
MATLERHIAASPDDVFGVLADGWSYSNWVVGASHIRAVEAGWPAVGTRIHHASGNWPLTLDDETRVEAVDPGRSLVLTARGRPLGEARIELTLEPEGTGTRVRMHETPVSGPGAWLHNPLSELVLARRNEESLSRLAAIAERRTTPGS